MKTKKFTGASFKAEDESEGYIEACFSTFDVVDRDGDVVAPGAIPEVEIPLVVAHNWSDLPVGKGRIYTDQKKAVFRGNFFMDTEHGRQAYLTAKGMGDLQQYSWAFDVLDHEKGEKNDKVVNIIKKTEPYEVTLALVGVNRETYTIDIKARNGDRKAYLNVQPTGSYEELKDDLCNAFRAQQFGDDPCGGYAYIVATYDDRFVACSMSWMDESETYWEVPYGRDSSGNIVLGTPVQVEAQTEFIPVGKGMTFNTHADYVQVAVAEFVKRSKAGSALRRKEGRKISDARRERLRGVVTWLQDAAKEVQNLLDETATDPEATETDTKASGRKLLAQFLKTEAKLSELGV